MNLFRKFCCSLLAVGALYSAANAQVHSIGPSIGANFSNVSSMDNNDYRPGVNVGIVYNYSRHQHLGFGLGAHYSQEGISLDNETSTRLDYLRIPVKFQYFGGNPESAFRPKAYFGPSVGVLLDAREKTTPTTTGRFNIGDPNYNTLDLGLVGGVGFNYRIMPSTWLNFDVAYTHGLTDISKAAPTNRNRNVNVNLGVAWGF